MSKAFDTITIHTIIRKLLQTNIPGTIIKFIANYMKGHKAYTTYRNHTSRRQFKTGVPQGGVLSPTLFKSYTPSYYHQVHRFRSWPTQMASPSHPQARVQLRNIYNHTYIKFLSGEKTKQTHTKSRQNNLHFVHARPCRIYEQSAPKNTQQSTTHGNAPKGYGSYLRLKLTYSTHIYNISVHVHNPLQIIKAPTATGWGKQKEAHMATYMALEYASSIWSPLASPTSMNKLQVMQNATLRTATGCTQDENIQHLHDETLTLSIHQHLQLHASQYKEKTQHPSHPLHNILQHSKAQKAHYF